METGSEAGDQRPTDDPRNETPYERLDRNTSELLNELRVAGTGIQVLLAFLLIVPFNTGFKNVSTFDHYEYYVTLLCLTIAAVLLIAPSVHHRILFRRGQKSFVVRVGTQLTIAAMVFVSIGLTGILVLITDVLFSGAAAAVAGALCALAVGSLWFLLPLERRRRPAADDSFDPSELG